MEKLKINDIIFILMTSIMSIVSILVILLNVEFINL
jgi:hypothetical protein